MDDKDQPPIKVCVYREDLLNMLVGLGMHPNMASDLIESLAKRVTN